MIALEKTSPINNQYSDLYSYELEAGKTYYLSVCNDEDYVKFGVSKSNPCVKDELEVGTELSTDSSGYYSFTPEENGTYYFYFKNYYNSIGLYDSNMETQDGSSVTSFNEQYSQLYSYTLKAAETYYLNVYGNSDDNVTVFGVSQKNPSITGELDLDTPITKAGVYSFTPDETTSYYFYVDGNNMGYMLYDDNKNKVDTEEIISCHDRCFVVTLNEGMNYYFDVSTYEDSEVKFGVSETRPELSSGELTLEESKTDDIDGTKTKYYDFTPEEAGTYYFYVNANSKYKLTLCNEQGESYDVTPVDGRNDVFSYVCEAGQKYYLSIFNDTYYSNSFTFGVETTNPYAETQETEE
jgi:hypothetical protein